MPKPTTLNCSRSSATLIVCATILLFILIGCQALFRSAGLSDDQAAQQIADLKSALAEATTAAIADVQTGLAEGHDLKSIAVKTGSTFIWKIITAGGAAIGIVLNGLLAKWLRTEKKITKTLITGIENDNHDSTKTTVHKLALAAGIEPQLHKRVKALT